MTAFGQKQSFRVHFYYGTTAGALFYFKAIEKIVAV